MPKASPLIRATNGGEISELVLARTDLDRYSTFLRRSSNFLPTAQGPAFRRSGTELRAPVYDEMKKSYFIEFAYSNDPGQLFAIEAADLRFRFHSEAGILARTPESVASVVADPDFMVLEIPGHTYVADDQTVFNGYDFATNLNGEVGNVTLVVGDIVFTDTPRPAVLGDVSLATAAHVYHIAAPYLSTAVENIRFLGDRDALYLFCDGYAPRKLLRVGAYDWRLTTVEFIDGPYDNINETPTTVTPSGTGNVVPVMTDNTTPAGYVASADTETGGNEAFHAFTDDADDYWSPTTDQKGILEIEFPAPVVVDGYSLEVAKANDNVSYKSIDYAPGSWTFEGWDGTNWIVLDSKTSYVVYDNLRSFYFKLKNATAYLKVRLNISECTRNGPLKPRVGRLVLTSRASASITLAASAITGINGDRGWLATDVGRAFRIQSKDSVWRALKITAWTDTTHVTAEVLADALGGLDATTEWRIGLFSDTSGYPTCATWFEDRMCMGGMVGYPDWLVCSVTGKYETIAQTDQNGTVNDDNGIVVRLNARRLGRIVWISSDNRSLLLGTGSGEWQVSSAELQAALTARTAKARRITVRGSANVEPILVDRQLLAVQRSWRTLREISYSFDIDGYKSLSLSLFSSHLGIAEFKQIVFAYEPLAVAWIRCGDGSLLGFTYNREENVIGWHRHDVGGFVESIAVLPAFSGKQDILWLIVRRTINGVERRFIERLMPVWDFDSTLDTAFFADCAVRYTGPAINKLYGMKHAAGARVVGLSNGSPIVPQIVAADGSVTLPDGATTTNCVLGFGYDAVAETGLLEAGAGDGTAVGKEKRVTGAVFRLWQSGGGQFGCRTPEDVAEDDNLERVDWLTPETQLDVAPPLFTGFTPKLTFPGGYTKSGSIIFRQSGDIPLPFNLIAIAPQVVTQDR